jgi:hypothetical protein
LPVDLVKKLTCSPLLGISETLPLGEVHLHNKQTVSTIQICWSLCIGLPTDPYIIYKSSLSFITNSVLAFNRAAIGTFEQCFVINRPYLLHTFLLTLWPSYVGEMLSAVSHCHTCAYCIAYRVSLKLVILLRLRLSELGRMLMVSQRLGHAVA